ncbi:heme/hemin ABC transporter substrate-binding protein [Minwuia sp.]|uniref:heme/hemin ABC transporter substrate-binding protein n=1 Tax=Minwuia sp. TaxID=2493630 RepID=UPI003A90A54F
MFTISRRQVLATSLVTGLAFAWPPATSADEPAGRLLSLGGSVTEIVYALGAQDRLVGVDSTSFFPEAAQALPNVGYLRRLSAEPVLALTPDLIIAEADAGPPEALAQLRAAGVAIVSVPDEPDIGGVLAKIDHVAAALGLHEKGAELARRVSTRYAGVRERVARVAARPKVMFVLSAGKGAPLVAGTGTSATAIIEMAGGQNPIDGFPDYRPMTPEAGINAQPDVILVTERTLKLLGGMDRVRDLPGIQGTPAARNSAIVAMDGLLLLGFGPRTPDAVWQLALRLHPGLNPVDQAGHRGHR